MLRIDNNKFGNIKAEADGFVFDSKRERDRYQDLTILVSAGQISGLVAQKELLRWRIEVNGVHICDYEADFSYVDKKTGEVVVEDSKGCKTAAYRLKKKLMLACHGVKIKET